MEFEKVTDARRRYQEACAATHAMGVLGERWAVPVMRELMLGPRRFGELKADIAGISAKLLTQRLADLEAAGVVRRHKLPPPASVMVYELTPWGYEAGPIFQAMGRWGVRSPTHDPTKPFSAVSLVISLRTMLDDARADPTATIGFKLGEQTFVWKLANRQVQIARGPVDGAQVVFEGPPAAIATAAYGGVPLGELEAAGELTITGDRALAERFLTWFPLPERSI